MRVNVYLFLFIAQTTENYLHNIIVLKNQDYTIIKLVFWLIKKFIVKCKSHF